MESFYQRPMYTVCVYILLCEIQIKDVRVSSLLISVQYYTLVNWAQTGAKHFFTTTVIIRNDSIWKFVCCMCCGNLEEKTDSENVSNLNFDFNLKVQHHCLHHCHFKKLDAATEDDI